MLKPFFFILLVTLLGSNNLFAQEKYEKESRIKRRDVPTNALKFIDSINFKTKIKWYKEKALTRESIEAKFRYNKLKYSIEFDTLGNIEDVEIQVKCEDLDSVIMNTINTQLNTDCTEQKIEKVQEQFIGDEKDLISMLRTNVKSEKIKIKYELIVKCNEQNEVNLFEYLFNESGLLISKSKIIFKNSSHLEY